MKTSKDKQIQPVTLFDSLDAATKGTIGAARSALGLAEKARSFWQSPNFQALSASLSHAEDLRQNIGKISTSISQINKQLSPQVPSLPPQLQISTPNEKTTEIIGSMATSGLSIISGLDLGIGLLNLGIGVYNAFQIKNLKQDIDSGFKSVERTLQWQNYQLEFLMKGQENIEKSLISLRKELRTGFEKIISSISAQSDNEYQSLISSVLKLNKSMTRALVAKELPNKRTHDNLFQQAHELDVKANDRLSKLPSGDPARLAHRVVQVLARRSYTDVNKIANEDKYRQSDIDDLSELLIEISNDVFCLCDKRSLYWLAMQVPDIISQYIYLFRGLKTALQEAAVDSSEILTIFANEPWDDGLAAMRELFNAELSSKMCWMRLRTIGDFEWLFDWRELDRSTTDISGIVAVNLMKVAKSLGATELPAEFDQESLTKFLSVALPSYRHQAQARLMSEFSWKHPPEITRISEFSDAEIAEHLKSFIKSQFFRLGPLTANFIKDKNIKIPKNEMPALLFVDTYKVEGIYAQWIVFCKNKLFCSKAQGEIVEIDWNSMANWNEANSRELIDFRDLDSTSARGRISQREFVGELTTIIGAMRDLLTTY